MWSKLIYTFDIFNIFKVYINMLLSQTGLYNVFIYVYIYIYIYIYIFNFFFCISFRTHK